MSVPDSVLDYFNQSAHDQPKFVGTPRFYIIFSTPRTGSNLLCNLLANNGIGVPHEYFQHDGHLRKMAARLKLIDPLDPDASLDVHAYIDSLIRHRTTPNGWFGAKLHFRHFSWLTEQVDIKARFPGAKYLYIDRKDQLAQAVSVTIAGQSGQWACFQQPRARPIYNFRHISENFEKLSGIKKNWRDQFKLQGLEVLDVHYEDIIVNPDVVCNKIKDWLDVTNLMHFDLNDTVFRKQQFTPNRQWIQRYRKDKSKSPGL